MEILDGIHHSLFGNGIVLDMHDDRLVHVFFFRDAKIVWLDERVCREYNIIKSIY